MKCKYKYKHKQKRFKNKECPYEAQSDSDYCKWHEKKDGKDFSGQTIQDTNLIEAYLVKANLYNTTFKENTDLSYANLQETNLSYAILQGAYLYYAQLQRVNLQGTNLQRAYLFSANLQETNLSYANLQGAYLYYAQLQRADLQEANLGAANLFRADLTDTLFNRESDLRGAFLYGAEIKNAKGLRYARISKKCIEEVIADKIGEILNSDKEYEDALKEALDSEFKYIGLNDEGEKASFITNLSKVSIDIYKKENSSNSKNKGETKNKTDNNKKTNNKKTNNKKIVLRDAHNQKNMMLCLYFYKLYLYEKARDVYINLKNYFKDIGYYDESGWFFIAEFRVRVKIYRILGDQIRNVLRKRVKHVLSNLIFWKKRKSEKTDKENNKGNNKGNKIDKATEELIEKQCNLIKEKSVTLDIRKVNEATEELIEKQCNLIKEKSITLAKRMLANYFAFLMNRLSSITSLYGESVGRVMATAFGIIFFYSLLFLISGAVESNSHAVRSFWDSFYFSIVTFTTLGYGDLHPVAKTWMRLTAGSEAFLGAFIIAYFVVVVSRKIMR